MGSGAGRSNAERTARADVVITNNGTLDELQQSIERAWDELQQRLHTAAGHSRHRAESSLAAMAGRLGNLNPLAVLARGYAVCWNAERTAIVRSAAAVAAGDRVHVTLHDGELHCDVRQKERDGFDDNQGL